MTPPLLDVGDLLDRGRWGGYQRLLVGLTATAIIFDGIDNQLMGVAIPTIMREWSVPRSAFAPVVSLGYVGMMIGGAIAGLVGDRLGRRVALLGSMLLFGVMTMAMTLVDLLTKPTVVAQSWDFFRSVQTANTKYTPLIRPYDTPAIWLNKEIMARYRPEMRKYYYDPTKYKTYLEQLGITYPTVKAETAVP